ncbi:hypothetical protein MFIFM68171_04892 [Madurella fahalii]|uniref:Heterokaryon incompatibility domain-containing protein n=1 Tax=Madurella fahalii TaxID=1157608 RepID=A0ABQ0GAA6_9PEZI
MRLLNTQRMRLMPHSVGLHVPPYAILSHTWDDEVLFEDICDPLKPLAAQKKGFAKIKGAYDQALQGGNMYIWIDTCRIDKSSNAELSEAINSMFRYYAELGLVLCLFHRC